MYKYDISIIIPVYNSEKYIENCVESIVNQDYDLNKIQLIMINDGSEDKSLEICNNLAKQYNNIKIINQENNGVSAARNSGIKVAEGKYIMFLDSDDFISENGIKNLIEFFDENYDDIDLVTYPIFNYNDKTKKSAKLKRYKLLFKKTGVYDLKENYRAIQTTVNVVVKNLKDKNILFDTNLFFHEDLKYNVEILSIKQKIGYVNNVKYFYRKFDESTSSIKDNPLYTFDQFTTLFNNLLDTYKDETGRTLRFVQSIILNTLRWRLEQDKLFSYTMDGNECLNRIKEILNKMDNEVIINDKQLHKYHKMYFIDLKNKDINIYHNYNLKKGTFSINDGENNILAIEKKIEIVLNRFKVKNNKIYILGYLKSPLLRYCEHELYLKYDNGEEKGIEELIETSESNADYFRTNIKVADFRKFDIKLDIDKIKTFKFKVNINGITVAYNFYFNDWMPFNTKIGINKIYYKNYKIEFKTDKFNVIECDKKQIKIDLKNNKKKFDKIDKKISLYRNLALSKRKNNKNNKIWLYYDRVGIFDNAYFQFKNDIHQKDDIEKYYILDGDIKDYKEKFTKEELKYVIKFGSFKHKILYLNSDKILTSFSSLQEFCPLRKNYQYYKDILRYELVYLQHGILHARLIKMYSKEFSPIDKFVISSEFEKNNLINTYNYLEEDLIPVGMPRLDEKSNGEQVKNKIIFAPSWRQYLIGEAIDRKREINENKFKNSKYYSEIANFLANKKLNEILKRESIVLDFKLHPNFKEYKDCFDEFANENINISIGEVNLEEYKLFITDFSSFQFDFVKLNRPITYFVPDMDEFKAGLHKYRELDLKHEDAFGKLCLTSDELINEVVNIIKNNCEVPQIYKERMEQFFYKVNNRKEKLYQELKGEFAQQ